MKMYAKSCQKWNGCHFTGDMLPLLHKKISPEIIKNTITQSWFFLIREN